MTNPRSEQKVRELINRSIARLEKLLKSYEEGDGEPEVPGYFLQQARDLIATGRELQRGPLFIRPSTTRMEIEVFHQKVEVYFASVAQAKERAEAIALQREQHARSDRLTVDTYTHSHGRDTTADSAIEQILDALRKTNLLTEGAFLIREAWGSQSPIEIQLAKIMNSISAETESEVSPTPVVLYLDNEDSYAEVRAALEKTMAAFGLKIAEASDTVRGSIWQAFVAVFKRETTPERIDDAAGILKAGAQARWLGEPQSQITKAQGEAIAALLTALQGNQNALLTFSNILVLKVDGVPVVRELTPEQVEHMQKNPRLYTDPRVALGVLDVGLTGVPESGPDDKPQAIAT